MNQLSSVYFAAWGKVQAILPLVSQTELVEAAT